ncbi:MAG: methyltransferase domain-containing protein [Myxococcota bacterium]
MEPGDLRVASSFCRLVQAANLFEYLGVDPTAPNAEIHDAFTKRRRRMQSMQANPKFRDSATFLIKNYRTIERVLDHPEAHLAQMRREREDEQIPMLELALQSAMMDGKLSANEESFLRQAAVRLGISEERYEEVLAVQAAAHNVVLETGLGTVSDEVTSVSGIPIRDPETEIPRTSKLRGAEGHGWWDAAFTRLLLETIPAGPGEMVDVYCRAGLSASTILPERPQLSWTGVDRKPERLAEARDALAKQSGGTMSRVRLIEGNPGALPLPDESMDYAVAIRALANMADTAPVLHEAYRVLRPGGRLVIAEPDGLAETFYFRGHLEHYNAAFHALSMQVDHRLGGEAAAPGRPGIAIGPTLPTRMVAAGFVAGAVRIHGSHNLQPITFARFARRLRRYPQALASVAGLEDSPELDRVFDEVAALEQRIPGDTVGMGGHLLPLFLAVGEKESTLA